MLNTVRGKLLVALSCVSAMALALASVASATLTVDAKDFTEPVESQLSTALPIVVGFIAVIFAVGFVVRWIMGRARSAS